MRLVLIRWADAMSDESGWKAIAKVQGNRPPVVRSVGWIVKRTKSHVTLAASIIEDHCDGDVVIPMGMVRSIEDLVTVKK